MTLETLPPGSILFPEQDLEEFGCRIRLREFFYDPEASDDEDEGNHQNDRKFREKSTWTPPKNRDAAIETYLKAVETDAWRLTRSTKQKDNLLLSE